jgi:ABC-type multidrug transport system ATPase subunit
LFTIASYGAAVAGGTTILLTTHNLEKAAALADRVAIIAVGRLVAVDSPERLTAQANSAATVRWWTVTRSAWSRSFTRPS